MAEGPVIKLPQILHRAAEIRIMPPRDLIGLGSVKVMKRISPILLMVITAGIFALTSAGGPVLRSLEFRDDFESDALSAWQFPYPEDWTILAEGANHYLHMLRNREPGVPRRPLQFARLSRARVGSFDFRARVRREGTSMIVVFNYVDTLHFYYAHLSADYGTKQPVHNGLFMVNGEPRQRIAGAEAEPALPDRAWHTVRVRRDVPAGRIEVFMDNDRAPRFQVIDRTFNCGEVGIGSFDETGDFDDIQLQSSDAGCKPGNVIRPASSR